MKATQSRFFLFVVLILAAASPALAQFPWAGARATGMGGAEVAYDLENLAAELDYLCAERRRDRR